MCLISAVPPAQNHSLCPATQAAPDAGAHSDGSSPAPGIAAVSATFSSLTAFRGKSGELGTAEGGGDGGGARRNAPAGGLEARFGSPQQQYGGQPPHEAQQQYIMMKREASQVGGGAGGPPPGWEQEGGGHLPPLPPPRTYACGAPGSLLHDLESQAAAQRAHLSAWHQQHWQAQQQAGGGGRGICVDPAVAPAFFPPSASVPGGGFEGAYGWGGGGGAYVSSTRPTCNAAEAPPAASLC